MSEKFWIEDPCALIGNLSIIPTSTMTVDEQLNSFTRLTLVVTGILYALKNEYWSTFLVVALLGVLIMKCWRCGKKEHFSIVPTYASSDYQQTVVAPAYAEEYRIYPPYYDYPGESTPKTIADFDDSMETLGPQNYPYGQYLTTTNLMPGDEYEVRLLDGSLKKAKEYANTSFLRHRIAHQENMSRIYKKKMARQFRHSLDTYSSFNSQ